MDSGINWQDDIVTRFILCADTWTNSVASVCFS